MTSLYDQTIPVLAKFLNNFSAVLDKAIAHTQEKGIAESELINARLIEDMRDLIYQVQSCCNTSVLAVERLAQREHVVVPDDETNLEQLKARLASTIDYLNGIKPEEIDPAIDREFIMESKVGNFKFASGQIYVSEFVIPNFHFHFTSAYCILRHKGVSIGAFDYMKDVFHKA